MSDQDASLLFGVFAVQFKKISPQQLHEVAARWQTDPSRHLSRLLVESGYLSEDDYNFLLGLVEDARRAHNGDASAALQTFGGRQTLQDTYRDSITLSHDKVDTVPMPEGAIPGVPLDTIEAVDETPGRYTNQSEYARGGIGRVLLVQDQHLGREIAMKELLPFTEYADESMRLEKSPVRQSMDLVVRFLQEARVTGQLEHPSIVPVYELGRRRDGTLYYTMKLVRGRTLGAAIREAKTLPERLALLSHIVDLCQAIAYSHSRRVIHRDIKPSNVMVGRFGETVVLDWGLAKVQGKKDEAAAQIEETLKTLRLPPAAKGHQTHAGQVLGTPTYMPPEQAAGQIDRIDERSDIYSLGAVLYTLLTGKYPYDGENASEILNRVLVGPPKPVLEVEPNAPPELAAICERAMQREADKRYKEAKDLADDVVRFQTGALVIAHTYKFKDHLKRFVQRHKPALATAALFTVALAVFAVYSYIRVTHERNDAIAARDSEAEQRKLATEARDAETEQRKKAERLLYASQIGLAQSQIDAKRFDLAKDALDAAPKEFHGWEWSYLESLCNEDSWTFAPGEGELYSLAVSGDRAIIAVGGNSGAAYVVDAKTGRLLKKLEGHERSVVGLAINSPATRILTVSSDQTAAIWDTSSGARLSSLIGHSEPLLECCAFTPDDQYAITTSSDGTVRLWNVSDGALVHTFEAGSRIVAAAVSADHTKVVVGTGNGTVKVWDLINKQESLSSSVENHSIQAINISTEGAVVAGSSEGAAFVWSSLTPSSTPVALSIDSPIINIAFSENGTQFVTTFMNAPPILWNTQTLTREREFSMPGTSARRAVMGATPHLLLLCADRGARVFDLASGALLEEFFGHSSMPSRGQFLANESDFITISDDGSLKSWSTDTTREKPKRILRGHTGPVRQVAYNASGTRLLTRSEFDPAEISTDPDFSVRVWDVVSGKQIAKIEPDQGRIGQATWNPDGRMIATCSSNGTVSLWDAESGTEQRTLGRQPKSLTSVTFSLDGTRLLTTCRDKTATVWNVRDGNVLLSLSGLDEEVFGGTFSPDGSRIATYGI
ncbi:MAG: protein kinase, partial [Candidatus Hydrogenedentes bacterium]|nr:protein kinase [Candidatus Hydrogenedentota bacterium]